MFDTKILHEDNRTKVYTYGCDEFFIEDKVNKTTIRVDCGGHGQTITSHDNYLLPTSCNGVSAFIVKKRD